MDNIDKKPQERVEVKALLQAIRNFKICKNNVSKERFAKDLEISLSFNERIWEIFEQDCRRTNGKLPSKVRDNLLALSMFVKNFSGEIRKSKNALKLDTLISINENIALGLRSSVPAKDKSAEKVVA